jgi:hypothetical protein
MGLFKKFTLLRPSNITLLEQAGGLAGLDIHIHPPECRVGTGARHQANGAGLRADILGAAVKQEVPDRQMPALRTPFTLGSWVRLK